MPVRITRWLSLVVLTCVIPCTAKEKESLSVDALIRVGVDQLLSMQEEDGAWPYEGVYRVRGKIPVGYRVGGTSLVCEALLYGAPVDNSKVRSAIERGIDLVLQELHDDRMAAKTDYRYDVRVWGQACALDFFSHLLKTKRAGARREAVSEWIPKLVATLLEEEVDGGGWNYAGRRKHASFVTGPVVQSLLMARQVGAKIPDKVFTRSAEALLSGRAPDGAYQYAGRINLESKSKFARPKLPGSIGRSPLCDTTLILLGKGNSETIKPALDAFHEHWDELEKRRKQNGTHKAPYGIAPYYFYFAHRYAAQAIAMLPNGDQASERARLLEKLLRTRDADGTWNDRVFPRTRNYGTAMSVIALLGDRFPLPARVKKK